MLSLTAVNQYYGQNHILWDINLEIPRGQCTCLIGRNGVGKTTLINCIMGHLPVMSGTMTGSRTMNRRRICYSNLLKGALR